MDNVIDELVSEIGQSAGFFKSSEISKISLELINNILLEFKQVLFPGVYRDLSNFDLRTVVSKGVHKLSKGIKKVLTFLDHGDQDIDQLTDLIISRLPKLRAALLKDINAIYQGDPAAQSHEEVVIAYPSFEAILVYRIAHELSIVGLDLFARICSSIAHRGTGIDIHPKAKIGESFCIDHGTGLVIGETSVIGNHVKLYQGVTIGALSVSKKFENKKRHPTIEDNVTIYARTTVLGGDTVIGENSIIGGNVWLTKSVPKDSKIYR